ncbi:MAG: T9SS type A sorting domain-containing protein [Flavobacteriaceae bacterium]|nr:T9SS type A sorting domain-containing protein [Flavobacteriaceae bacterium]
MNRFLSFYISFLMVIFSAQSQSFGAFETAVFVDLGNGATFYNTLGTGIGSLSFENDLTQVNTAQGLLLIGAEAKTFNNSANVCSVELFYVVYPAGQRPANPNFSSTSLPFFENCSSGAFQITGGLCSAGDQKWQRPGSDVPLNIDVLNGLPAGNYSLEVFYEITGDLGDGSCSLSEFDNNAGNNYVSTFNFNPTLSLNEVQKPAINFYPNPFKNTIRIQNLKEAALIKVYDLTGKLVYQNTTTESVDLSQLVSGIYMIKIAADKETKTFKIIKR